MKFLEFILSFIKRLFSRRKKIEQPKAPEQPKASPNEPEAPEQPEEPNEEEEEEEEVRLMKLIAGAHGKGSTPSTTPYLNQPRTISDLIIFGGGTSIASFTVGASGVASATTANTGSVSPTINAATEWVNGGTASDWEVQFTKTSGVDPNVGGLTLGTWYPCTSDRTIGHTISTTLASPREGVFTVSFRLAGTTTPVYSFSGLTIRCEIN